MAGEHSANASIHLMRETGGFGVIPDATGAAALPLPARRGITPVSEAQIIRQLYATGRNKAAPGKAGKTGGAVPFTSDIQGFALSELVPPNAVPAEDALDLLLRSMMGDPVETFAGVTTAGTANTFNTVTNLPTGALVALHDAATNNNQLQWARVFDAVVNYQVSPAFRVVPGIGDAIAACRTWSPVLAAGLNPHTDRNADSLTAIVDVDDRHYFLPGARPVSFSMSQKAGEAGQIECQLRANDYLRQQAGALPAVPVTLFDAAIGLLTPVSINDVLYPDIMEMRFDSGIQVSECAAQGANRGGRSNFKVVGFDPVFTCNPLNTTAFEDLYHSQADFPMTAQFGIGELANGRLNSMVVHFEFAQVTAYPGMVDDEGKLRTAVEIRPHDGGATGLGAPLFQIARC